MYNTDLETYANQVAVSASNIKAGDNPKYELKDFYIQYPQFGPNISGEFIVPEIIMQMYLNLADASIKESRWHTSWKIAMGWFIAHFLTLYVQGMADPNGGAAAVIKAGQARGLESSVSVGDVHVSTDYSTIANGIDGWANWLSTSYGTQLATIGRFVGKGGMCVR
ncbi:hypothetical protein CLPUN_42320 [Clostridium puniceum]|uniref:DUF4054 domain-containing protein n=1 Tax=Clostridium puniceum TaxID=29367 RepID=A0A1S8T8P4_9CLOT|nr:DUF4054 domain-containing protein [Clostridium puniceum]OOM73994.1 hypothetical protein CLPUN_42320 [Clostridium puniceum]